MPAARVFEPAVDRRFIDSCATEERMDTGGRCIGEAPAGLDARHWKMFDDPFRCLEIDGLKFDSSPRSGFAHLRLVLAADHGGEGERQSNQKVGYAHSRRGRKREAGRLQVKFGRRTCKNTPPLSSLPAQPYGHEILLVLQKNRLPSYAGVGPFPGRPVRAAMIRR
jgi:hypothetical protein